MFGLLFGGNTCASTLRHLLSQFAHRLRRDRATFTTSKRRFRLIDSDQNFRAPTFALLPQRKSFLHCVFLAPKPSALNRLPDKGSLVGGEVHFHMR